MMGVSHSLLSQFIYHKKTSEKFNCDFIDLSFDSEYLNKLESIKKSELYLLYMN